MNAPSDNGDVTVVKANRFDRVWADCRADVSAAVEAVGASGWYILGEEVKAFESQLAEYCGAAHAIGCGNGMDALELSLRALGLQAGDKVITTPLSAFATTLAIARAGGVPVFCDVDESGLLDLAKVDACIRENGDIRFLMPVHLYGHALDIVALKGLAQRHRIKIVEDAAQAIGARRAGESIGDAGETTCFSFYPTKNLGTLGDGGAIVTHDAGLAAELRVLRNYGQKERYVHSHLGLNSRLDELHAGILRRAFLPRLTRWTQRRREIAQAYRSGIKHPLVKAAPALDPAGSVWHIFPVLVPRERRPAFMDWMKRSAIDSDIHYPRIIADQEALKLLSVAPIVFGSLSRAREFAETEVSLPINAYLTDSEVKHVVDTINAWEG